MAAENDSRLQLLIDAGLRIAAARDGGPIVDIALGAALQLSGGTLAGWVPAEAGPGYRAAWRTVEGPLRPEAEAGSEEYPTVSPKSPTTPGSPTNVEAPDAAWSRTLLSRVGAVEITSRSGASGCVLVEDLLPWQSLLQGSVAEQARSLLAVASTGRMATQLGTLLVFHPRPAFFDVAAERLLTSLAAQTGFALENAQLAADLIREIARADAMRADQRATSLRLLHALDAAEMGTWNWDAASGLIDFDERAANLFGVAARTPLSRHELRRKLIFSEDLAFAPEDLLEVAERDGVYNVEYRLTKADGGQRWVSVRGNAKADGSGKAVGMVGTVQDISDRKAQEEALRTSEKLAATGRLAATIAHEINNPLEAVTNLIYLSKTDPETPPSISRMLEIADGELARVSQIAQHTLGFYRDTTRPVTIDLNELLGAMVELFERKLSGKHVHCTLDLEPGLSVIGLQGEIRQVVSNLLVNAIDASPGEGGQIRIRGRHRHRPEGKGVAVMICDQGCGIPTHLRQRLFTPFMTTKRSTGTGLGLWVTRGMVEKHGGSVCFRSRTEQPSGTVFRIFLPHSGAPQLFGSPSAAIIQ